MREREPVRASFEGFASTSRLLSVRHAGGSTALTDPLYPFEVRRVGRMLDGHTIKKYLKLVDGSEYSNSGKRSYQIKFEHFEACVKGNRLDADFFAAIRGFFNWAKTHKVKRQKLIFRIFPPIVNQNPGLHNFDKRSLKEPPDFDTRKTRLLIVCGLVKGRCERDLDNAKMDLDKKKVPPAKMEPEEMLLRVVLMCTQSLYECRETLPEKSFDDILEQGKKVLVRCQRDTELRYVDFTHAFGNFPTVVHVC